MVVDDDRAVVVQLTAERFGQLGVVVRPIHREDAAILPDGSVFELEAEGPVGETEVPGVSPEIRDAAEAFGDD